MLLTESKLRRIIRRVLIESSDLDELDEASLQQEKLKIIKKMNKGPLSADDLQRLMRVNTLENELKVNKAKEEMKNSGEEFDKKLEKRYAEHQEKLAKQKADEDAKFIARQKEYDAFLKKFQKHLNDQKN